MGYLYKLVDDAGLNDARNGVICLSHPIFEFKGSEGKFINFAKRIYDKYEKKGLKIKPSTRDLEEIEEWCKTYKNTYGPGFNDCDIHSESMIIFCGIIQGFCGYFTKSDLSIKEIRDEFINKCNLKGKVAIIRINENVFSHKHWRSKNSDGEYIKYYGDKDNCRDFNGFLHPIDIVYTDKFDDYNELLKIYNSDEVRHASAWFNNLSSEYEWQNEKRLIFLMRSLAPNSSRIGCDSVYKFEKNEISWTERVYGNMVDAIDWCNKGPRFVKLKLKPSEIEIFEEFK